MLRQTVISSPSSLPASRCFLSGINVTTALLCASDAPPSLDTGCTSQAMRAYPFSANARDSSCLKNSLLGTDGGSCSIAADRLRRLSCSNLSRVLADQLKKQVRRDPLIKARKLCIHCKSIEEMQHWLKTNDTRPIFWRSPSKAPMKSYPTC